MALVARITVTEGGTTHVSICFNAERTGSSNDRYAFRCVRRMAGQVEFILPGTLDFTLRSGMDSYSWTFIDHNLPVAGTADYVLQIFRKEGGGTMHEVNIIAVHWRK